MRGYSHLAAAERGQIADLQPVGRGGRATLRGFGRSAATISREPRQMVAASR
jgi:IS30 family transposase